LRGGPLTQNAKARMYGPFLAVYSLGVLEFDVINRRQQCSKAALLVNAVIHAAIVQTHLLRIIYSGAILYGFVVQYRSYAKHRSRSHDAVICVCDESGNLIETREYKGDFKEPKNDLAIGHFLNGQEKMSRHL
jgi:hypothetical protein